MNLNFIDRLKYYYIGAIVIMDNSIIKGFKVEWAKLNFIQDKILVFKKVNMFVVMDSYYTNQNHNFNIVAVLYFAQNYLNIMVIILE